MKRLLYLILLFPFVLFGQVNGTLQKTVATGTIRGTFGSSGLDTIQTKINLPTINALVNYSGASNVIVVTDTLRGGTFIYSSASLAVNNGTTFTATGKGSGVWKRQYDRSYGVNVDWFGAVPNGVTLSTGAIQRAINYASLTGGEDIAYINFSPGTYFFSGITINSNNINLRGAPGRGTTSGGGTILQMKDTANVAIQIATTIQTQRVNISGLVIVGEPTCLGGIALGNASFATTFSVFDNLFITNFKKVGGYGISLNAVQELSINNTRITANYYNIYRPNLGYTTTFLMQGSNSYLGFSSFASLYAIGDISDMTFRDVVVESDSVQFIKSTGNTAFINLQNCYFEGSNTKNTGTALIEIIGKTGVNNESTLIMDNCNFHNTANPQYIVKLDYALGFINNNRGLFDSGGALTTANSKTYWKYNGVIPSSANYKNIYAALLGTVITEDNNYSDNPTIRFMQGGANITGLLQLNTVNAGVAGTDSLITIDPSTRAVEKISPTYYAPTASPTFTGTVTIPTPFTLGATSVTSTGTQLNYLAGATGTTGTTSTNLVFSTNPVFIGPTLGVASMTTLTGGKITSTVTAGAVSETWVGVNLNNTTGTGVRTTYRGSATANTATMTIDNVRTNRATSGASGDTDYVLSLMSGSSLTERFRVLDNGNITNTGGLTMSVGAAAAVVLTWPTTTGTLSTLAGSEALTNKTYAGSTVDITGNSSLATSSGNVGVGIAGGSVVNPAGFNKVLGISHATDVALILSAGTNDFSLSAQSGRFSIYNEAVELFNLTNAGVATVTNLAGTGSRAVLADASGVLSAPVSDRSVKEHIRPMKYGIREIMLMKPVTFEYRKGYKNYGEGDQMGNIAQDMAKIIPEAVFTTPSTGKMGINYMQFDGIYIKALQDLQNEITALQTVNNGLQKRIIALEKK